MSKFIGIDPSLTGTAICVLEAHSSINYKIEHLETISTTPKIPHLKRLKYIVDRVALAIPKNSGYVVIEGYSFGSRGSAVFDLAELGGLLRMMLATDFEGYFEVAPSTLKKFVTGKGTSPKNLMLERCYKKFGVGSETLKDDNQVDAFCLAQYALSNYKDMEKVVL
jgi:crossover junction endodeoxyribonuclease RuvC